MANILALVLDAGPLLTQSYADVSPLASSFYTTPAVHAEIRDERARQNLLLWGESLVVRQPKPEYMKIVTEFSKKTGDYTVLSSTDLGILALCYELEVELNNGDWRLRKYPGEKRAPAKAASSEEKTDETVPEQKPQEENSKISTAPNTQPVSVKTATEPAQPEEPVQAEAASEAGAESSINDNDDDEWTVVNTKTKAKTKRKNKRVDRAFAVAKPKAEPAAAPVPERVPESAAEQAAEQESSTHSANGEGSDDSDDEDGDWITSDNIQDTIEQGAGDIVEKAPQKKVKAAMSSGDFAMQNVALQIGLNLVNPTNGRYIRQVKNYMLRCHACFKLVPLPKTEKPIQFCPRCGGNTLLRCSVSVSDNGKIQVHLKKNMQWSHRGDRYSLPTPQSKNARRTRQEENPVLLREDQKEYQKAVKDDLWRRRQNEKILDEWIGTGSADNVGSPFAISGYKRDPTRHSGVRIGSGRYVNSARRKR